MVGTVSGVELRHLAKFRRWHIAIFWFFQDGGRCHRGFWKFRIFNGRTRHQCRNASPCQISSKSLAPRPKYYASLAWKFPSTPPFGVFGEHFPQNNDVAYRTNPKRTVIGQNHVIWAIKREYRSRGSSWALKRENKRTGQERSHKMVTFYLFVEKPPLKRCTWKNCLKRDIFDVITCAKFQNKIFRGYDFTGVEFPIFLLIFEWALKQCRACGRQIQFLTALCLTDCLSSLFLLTYIHQWKQWWQEFQFWLVCFPFSASQHCNLKVGRPFCCSYSTLVLLLRQLWVNLYNMVVFLTEPISY